MTCCSAHPSSDLCMPLDQQFHNMVVYYRAEAEGPYYPFKNRTEANTIMNKWMHNMSEATVNDLSESYRYRSSSDCFLCE